MCIRDSAYVDHLTEILKSALDGGVFTQEDKDIMEFIQGVESGKEPLDVYKRQTKTNINRMNEILDHPVQTGNAVLTNQGCDIVFDHVGFAYRSGETVLKEVSFTARQGEVTALVGPSGGGKTTVSRLAARFWDIDKGKITVGGMDVTQIEPESLLSLYSIVFQDVTPVSYTHLDVYKRQTYHRTVTAIQKTISQSFQMWECLRPLIRWRWIGLVRMRSTGSL